MSLIFLFILFTLSSAFETVQKTQKFDDSTETEIFDFESSVIDTPKEITSRSYKIQHSIDSGWNDRGTVVITFASGTEKNSIKFSKEQINVDELKSFDETTMYKIRFLPTSTKNPHPIQAAVPLCQLISSSFFELLNFHFSQSGHLASVSYSTPITACSDKLNEILSQLGENAQFKQKSRLSFGRRAEDVKFIRMQSIKTDAEILASASIPKDADGKPIAEKTFWEKYWVYILPMVFIVALNIFFAPPEAKR